MPLLLTYLPYAPGQFQPLLPVTLFIPKIQRKSILKNTVVMDCVSKLSLWVTYLQLAAVFLG